MKKSNKKGFTIVELVIVIAVIAILAAVLIPTFSNIIDKAKDSEVIQQASAAYKLYLADFNYTTGTPKDDLYVKIGTQYVQIAGGKLVNEVLDTAPSASPSPYIIEFANGAVVTPAAPSPSGN